MFTEGAPYKWINLLTVCVCIVSATTGVWHVNVLMCRLSDVV